MPRIRALFAAAAAATALVTLGLHAQPIDPNRYDVQENLGLPAISRGVSTDNPRTPRSAEVLRRAAMQAVYRADGVGSSGARYARGRLIVKFKDDATAAGRQSAIASISSMAAMAARPSHANFDMVTIDLNQDAETAAR